MYAILAALLELLPFVALLVIVLFFICAAQRNWPRLPQRWRARRVPSCNPDGEPLSQAMTERLRLIERGYAETAPEPGRRQ